ncbi:AAA family ATPase [Changchengzhania lutea]|uniref:AAA family ATPase n=1 Tax=Changchengzhania lutea TaxID=2049305 RepID=UPI00115DA2C9|nr:ATP-binding protein [Changchengzhania lutea]
MNTKKIVITGGPGTGKSSIINELIKRGYTCLEEISRAVTLDAQEQGIDQLFLTKPLLFSELLLKGRKQQYKDVKNLDSNVVFFDRGIPDIVAYMDFIGDKYPQKFINACERYPYNQVFILKPWQEIYTIDNERYEDFDQALKIHDHLLSTYQNYNYKLLDVPFDTVERRADFILQSITM